MVGEERFEFERLFFSFAWNFLFEKEKPTLGHQYLRNVAGKTTNRCL